MVKISLSLYTVLGYSIFLPYRGMDVKSRRPFDFDFFQGFLSQGIFFQGVNLHRYFFQGGRIIYIYIFFQISSLSEGSNQQRFSSRVFMSQTIIFSRTHQFLKIWSSISLYGKKMESQLFKSIEFGNGSRISD